MAVSKIVIPIEAEDKASKVFRDVAKEAENLDKQLDGMSDSAKGVTKPGTGFELTELKSAINLIGMAVDAATAAAGALYSMGRAGAEASRMGESFELMAGGSEKSAEMLERLRSASLGTIDDMGLMATANRAIMLGVTADSEEMARLLEIAAIRGRAMGVSTQKAFEDIATGIGRGSPLILDNLGIVVDSKKNYEDYARVLGKSATQLTKNEKAQALLNAVLEDGNRILAESGGLAADNMSSYERLEASWSNYTGALHQSVDNQINPVVNALAGMLHTATTLRGKFDSAPLWTYLFPPAAAVASIVEIVQGLNQETSHAIKVTTGQAQAQQWMADSARDAAAAGGELNAALAEQEKAASDANASFLDLVDRYSDMSGKSADEVEASTRRIVLSMLERKLAIDGLDERETNYLLNLGVKWGVYTEEAAEQARNAIAEVDKLARSINDVPEYKSFLIEGRTILWDGERGLETYVPPGGGGMSSSSQSGGGATTVVLNYSPAVSLASADEAQSVLLPYIRNGVNSVMAAR